MINSSVPNTSSRRRVGLMLFLLVTSFANAAPKQIDLLVFGDHVVTMDQENSLFNEGAVAVNDGLIIAVGSGAELKARYSAREVLAGHDKVVLPGLINGHSHAAMTMLRGLSDDLELMEWLNEYVFPTEVRFVDDALVRIGTELACLEMIRGGTTTFVDMYYFPDRIAEVVDRCGMRAIITTTIINQKSPDAAGAQAGLKLAREFAGRWRGKNSRITPGLGPHALYTLTPELLRQVRQLATELDIPVSIHLAESQFELANSRERFNTTPIHYMDSLGFFNGPTVGAHLVWPTESEIPVLAERGVGAIHNPTSNMKIASGIAPVTAFLAAGIAVGIGTDGAATNNDLNLWEEMRLAAFLQKVHTMEPTVLPAPTVLRMATAGGARAIGLEQQIGSLEIGKRADLIQVSLDDPRLTPMYDVVSHLVYVANEQDVDSVVVDGKVIMRERKVLTLDRDRVRAEANELAARIQAALEH